MLLIFDLFRRSCFTLSFIISKLSFTILIVLLLNNSAWARPSSYSSDYVVDDWTISRSADNPVIKSSGKLYLLAAVNSPVGGKTSFRIRALHISLEPAKKETEMVSADIAKKVILKAKANGFNTLIILLANFVRLKSMTIPPDSRSWTTTQFVDVVKYARDNGIDVIPEVKLLTHQEKFFSNNYPALMYNRVTYDPRKAQVYDIVYKVIDELTELIHPRAIHIGHDEAAGSTPESVQKWLAPGETILPAELYLEDTKRINAYLNSKGVETWMWGDMLISHDEFPSMQDWYFNGGAPGYGKLLRHQLPKNIVICDWHYTDSQPDFPSLSTFKREGFKVLGATWRKQLTIRNFSRYAYDHGAEGMIATTWSNLRQEDWNTVDEIIRDSGEVFTHAK